MDVSKSPRETYLKALQAVRDGEARNLSERTMNKKWKALFSAEDALKGQAEWRWMR